MSRPEDRSRTPGELREIAARPVLAAIEHDEAQAPSRLRPVFRAIRRLLFRPKLSLEKLRAAVAAADGKHLWELFSEAVGRSPWSYVKEARLETAARLLLYTSLKVKQIAPLVGYPNVSAFRRAFSSFAGASPVAYQRRVHRLLRASGPPPRDVDDPDFWDRALGGELSDPAARELDGALSGLFPAADPGASSEAWPWIRMRTEMALALVGALDELPWSDQRLLVRDATWFPDSALFNVLSLCASEAGRSDPRRGVELSLLAIDSLAANGLLGVDPGLAVLGWTHVARARWRDGDLPGAQEAWKQVGRDLGRYPPEERHPLVEAERCRVKSAWQWCQGRPRRALELADESVRQERARGAGGLGRVLLLRAEIRASLDPPRPQLRREVLRAALDDLEEARGHAGTWDWEWPVAFELWLLVLVRLGDRNEINRALPDVRRLAEQLGGGETGGGEAGFSSPMAFQAITARLRWFEGRVLPSRERLWEARDAFAESDEDLWKARVTLALLRGPQPPPGEEERADARKLAGELAAALGALAHSSESLAVVRALERSAASDEETGPVLDAAGIVLERSDAELRARQALRFADEERVDTSGMVKMFRTVG